MTQGVRIAAGGVALAVTAVLLQGSLASASPADPGAGRGHDRTLRFDVEFSPFSYTDLGEPGPGPADLIVFSDVLRSAGAAVGREVGSCVVVDAAGLSSCTAVLTVDDGTVTYALENSPPPRKVLAVTGGTGRYRSAGGEGALVEHGDGTGTLTLDLDLPRG